MNLLLTIALLVCICAAVVLCYRPVRQAWIERRARYYVGRLSLKVGHGTAWVLWLSVASGRSPSPIARAMLQEAWRGTRDAEVDRVAFHRDVIAGIRASLCAQFDPSLVELFIADVELESARRDAERIDPYEQEDRTREILARAADRVRSLG